MDSGAGPHFQLSGIAELWWEILFPITTAQLAADSGPFFSFLCLKLILNVSGLGNTKLENIKDMHTKGERNSPEWKRAD